MATGLLALLDDIALLIKASAASLDDIPPQVAKTSGKVSGIVVDDAAVTPKYVVGLDPSRELTIIYRIARRSLIHKLTILGPGALVLGVIAPWAIQPLLMVGGAYLCLEGYEKAHAAFTTHEEQDLPEAFDIITPEQLEALRIKSAVSTDFILSAEIIAITYASVADKDLTSQIVVMLCIAIGITLAVYGFVGLLVKMDDIGLYLAKNSRYSALRKLGSGLVRAMPHFLKLLSAIGTLAMLWVGAEIIAHGIAPAHHALESLQAAVPTSLAWPSKALACAAGGLVLGAILEKAIRAITTLRKK